ncbi:T9SS type A sorting domain-containing protein [Flavobacteriales bacterium]|nr:T9SS type A sorting domain-containing protein [Flavobacteriales bacterium]
MNRFFIFFLCISQIALGQEFVNPLMYNSQLPKAQQRSLTALSSTLQLPFFDDFSDYKGFPKSSHWLDEDVFVNRTYPVNPLNLGVATFDGLDSIGNPRNIASETVHGPSDYLTSRPIDLSTYSEVYLSFYIQSTGIGNEPESNDIFKLECLDTNLVWQTVWDTTGYSLSGFKKVKLNLDEPEFLFEDFQFRFHNEATLSGNFDHWHIDNVLLTDDYTLSEDNEDVAFVYETSQMLNFYTSIPWSHFNQNRAAYMSSTMDTWLRNNYSTDQSVDYRYDVYKDNNELIFHYPSTGPSRNDVIPPFLSDNFSYSDDSPAAITVGSSVFPSPVVEQEVNSYVIEQSIATDDNVLFKTNDTLRYVQNFVNYYALDDGSAEASYGINVEGGLVAMLFNVSEEDTLKAVQIHFEENYEDSEGLAFSITLWNSQSGTPGDIIYQSQIFYPKYTDSKNGFYEYVLENPIRVSGSVFVGWEQYYNEIINVGLDRNTTNNNRMFYNLGAGWNQSNCADCDGTWMIRPVFGKLMTSSVDQFPSTPLTVYPNPANSEVSISFVQPFDLSVYDLNAKLIHSQTSDGNIRLDLTSYEKGIYIIEILSEHRKYRKKLVVQ